MTKPDFRSSSDVMEEMPDDMHMCRVYSGRMGKVEVYVNEINTCEPILVFRAIRSETLRTSDHSSLPHAMSWLFGESK